MSWCKKWKCVNFCGRSKYFMQFLLIKRDKHVLCVFYYFALLKHISNSFDNFRQKLTHMKKKLHLVEIFHNNHIIGINIKNVRYIASSINILTKSWVQKKSMWWTVFFFILNSFNMFGILEDWSLCDYACWHVKYCLTAFNWRILQFHCIKNE